MINLDKIEFDLEASEQDCAFYAIYTGLRMCMEEQAKKEVEGSYSLVGAEAYCMLQQLKEKHPIQYLSAKNTYESGTTKN